MFNSYKLSKWASGFTIQIGAGNLGTEEIETPLLTVYPNPARDVLFLQLNKSTVQIDVLKLPAGTYIVKVQDQKNSLIQKITIE